MATISTAEQAALAFSAMPAVPAREIADRLSLTERLRLREGLARARTATNEERAAALAALVAAVRSGVDFPPPLSHDESHCPFRRCVGADTARLVAACERFSELQPSVAAVALCHFSAEVRDAVWDAMAPRARAAVRPCLAHVPRVPHVKTRRYAQDFDAQVRRPDRARTDPRALP